MPHFDIPLDLPHASRLAERIVNLLEPHVEENALSADAVLDAAVGLSSFLFRFGDEDDAPPDAQCPHVPTAGRNPSTTQSIPRRGNRSPPMA